MLPQSVIRVGKPMQPRQSANTVLAGWFGGGTTSTSVGGQSEPQHGTKTAVPPLKPCCQRDVMKGSDSCLLGHRFPRLPSRCIRTFSHIGLIFLSFFFFFSSFRLLVARFWTDRNGKCREAKLTTNGKYRYRAEEQPRHWITWRQGIIARLDQAIPLKTSE